MMASISPTTARTGPSKASERPQGGQWTREKEPSDVQAMWALGNTAVTCYGPLQTRGASGHMPPTSSLSKAPSDMSYMLRPPGPCG
eukprot:288124-Pyramimonas_sp.AAC.1